MRYVIITLLSLICFSACKKADSPQSMEEQLRAGRWKMTVGTMRVDPFSGIDTTYNYFKDWPDCKKDDYLSFRVNYEGAQQSNALKCSSSDPEEIQFTWELINNDNNLIFYNANATFFGLSTVKSSIVNFMSNRLTIRYVEYVPSPVDITKLDTLTFTNTFVTF